MNDNRPFIGKASKQCRDVVAAISSLADSEGYDMASRAFAAATRDIVERHLAERYRVKRSNSRPCIQRLISGSCAISRQKNCHCHPPGTDHPSLWIRDGKPYLFVSQPYDLCDSTLGRIAEYCQLHRLSATITTYPAFYAPSRTLMIIYRRESDVQAEWDEAMKVSKALPAIND